MKFKSITINNFMRYKGQYKIEFSCDTEKNVTVVMGDNTFGKTTLAQAFRWGLYGEIIDTRYGKSKDIILLNKDVLSEMGSIDEKEVFVILEVEEGNVVYQFKREAVFTRLFPAMATKRSSEKLWMRRKVGKENWEEWKDNDANDKKLFNCVNDNIKIMFPKELSSYFLFDGERWSDERKTNAEIRNSISTLMGITPLVKMRDHLWNGNAKSVIKSLNAKITGRGEKYEDIRREIDDKEKRIDQWKQEIEAEKENQQQFHEKVEQAKKLLESNKKVENYQKEYIGLEKNIKVQEQHLDMEYVEMIKLFSKEAHKFFAVPLLEDVVELLKGVNLEGKDIPGVTSATLDYLLEHHTCLCGNELGKKEIEYFEELRKLIRPNVIGSYVGRYQERLEEWKLDTVDFVESIKTKADNIEGTKSQIEDDNDRKMQLEKIIDGRINFALKRKEMNANQEHERRAMENIRKCELNITEYQDKIRSLQEDLKRETAHTEENRRVQRMIAYAEALYSKTTEILKQREEPLLDELNVIIRNKFNEMFNEKEKFAQMGEDYRLHLYYHNMGKGDPVEELALSEGEIIARNFVFIVSILELAQKKKKEDVEKDEESDVLNLPLVLDGPFSKLGDTNTGLIAKVLPEVSEQVIVFMLDKDWEASGLEAYTLPEYRYYIYKDADANSAMIKRR